MKVAFISYDFGEYCIRLAGALAHDNRVLLVLPRQLSASYLNQLDHNLIFHAFDKPRLRQPLRQTALLVDIRRTILNFDPDVIHLQQGHFWFNFVLPFLRNYPLVLTVHDPRHHRGDIGANKTPQMIIDMGFRRADRLIVHSEAMKKVVAAEVGIGEGISHVIPHIGIGDDTACADIKEDGDKILFFGRIWEYKGLDYLIRAQPLITMRQPDARIIIAGSGENFARYRQMMVNPEKFEIHNHYISDSLCAKLFRRSSVVVLPYVEATQSGVIPLAYTFAKPVIATSVGSFPEQIEHNRTGLLVPPRDERALADAVLKLLQDKQLCRAFGRNGKQKITVECSPEAVARKTLAVYEQAVRAKGS